MTVANDEDQCGSTNLEKTSIANHKEKNTRYERFNLQLDFLCTSWYRYCSILADAVVTCGDHGTVEAPKRRQHVVQLFGLLGVLVLAIGIQQYVQWKILLPSLARQQLEAQEARRVEKDIETSLLRVGDQVPNMTLVTVAGQSITIPNGKPMVINFFATWCGPCLIELPHIEAIWSDLAKDEGMGLVVIGREETEESILKFMETKKFSFPVVADTDSTIFSQFAKSTIPRTYVISPNGKIVYASIGFVESDVDKLKSAIHDQVSLPPSNSMLAE